MLTQPMLTQPMLTQPMLTQLAGQGRCQNDFRCLRTTCEPKIAPICGQEACSRIQPYVDFTLADPAMPISPTYVATGYLLCKPFVQESCPRLTSSKKASFLWHCWLKGKKVSGQADNETPGKMSPPSLLVYPSFIRHHSFQAFLFPNFCFKMLVQGHMLDTCFHDFQTAPH